MHVVNQTARHYHATLQGVKGSKVIFTGTVVKKTQASGRVAGPVRETLHVKDASITIKNGKTSRVHVIE